MGYLSRPLVTHLGHHAPVGIAMRKCASVLWGLPLLDGQLNAWLIVPRTMLILGFLNHV
jgi:hypothetical protein